MARLAAADEPSMSQPSCCDSNACFALATFSRIWPADLVKINGLGSALWFSSYSMMALLNSATLLKVPRRIRFRVISAEPLDHVEPRSRSRREVQMEAGD